MDYHEFSIYYGILFYNFPNYIFPWYLAFLGVL